MDQLTLSLLTIAVNALITYFLLNRQEKRLAQKAFEDQLKFKRIHEKQMETLEVLYQKFIVFYRSVSDLISDAKYYMKFKKELEPDEYGLRYDPILEKHHDFLHYYQSNRIYLPDHIAEEVWNIYDKSMYMQGWVGWLFHGSSSITVIPEAWTKKMAGSLSFKIANLAEPKAFLDAISVELDMEAKTLDQLYRSAAEMKE